MEAQVSSPGAAPGVPWPLRGVPCSRGFKLIADAANGTDDSEPGANQLHLDAESHRRRARLAAADRRDATRAVSADLVVAMLARKFVPSVGLQEVRDHVHLHARVEHGPP